MRRRGARIGPILAALAALGIAAPAVAQNVGEGDGGLISATLAPPAERLAVTPGGVDMRTGRYQHSPTDLAIGEDNETGGLALTRSLGSDGLGHLNPFGNFSHNFDIFIDLQLVEVGVNGNSHVDRARVHFGGRSETFEMTGGYYEQVSRSGYARLTLASGSPPLLFTFTSNDGTVAVFRPLAGTSDCSTILPCAYVATVTYADGTRYSFDYDAPTSAGTAHLRSVTSNRGYALLFQYGSGADADTIVSACLINLSAAPAPANHACPASPLASASYAYTSAGGSRRLAAATDAGNATWSYGYPAATSGGYSMTFTRPGETAPWLTNNVVVRPTQSSVDDIVMQQIFADSSTYAYSYDFSPDVPGEIPQLAGGYYVDPAGHTVEVRYDFPIKPGSTWGNVPQGGGSDQQTLFYQITPGPVRIVDALGRTTTTNYCDPNAAANLPSWEQHRCLVMPTPVSFTSPEGIRTDLIWDYTTRLLLRATQHARPGTSPAMADIVRSASYNCTPATMASCAKPVTRTDANGNVTNYSYDPVHGGLLSETGPAPSAGAPRPQARHEYAQRYAWLANGSGGYVASGPIWVRTATSTCRTSAATGNAGAPCAVAGDEVRTTYDYGPDSGPNTLLLRGQLVTATDGGTARSYRTCYGYDARGRRISETRPNANLASCP